jgi:hypothetical protein
MSNTLTARATDSLSWLLAIQQSNTQYSGIAANTIDVIRELEVMVESRPDFLLNKNPSPQVAEKIVDRLDFLTPEERDNVAKRCGL